MFQKMNSASVSGKRGRGQTTYALYPLVELASGGWILLPSSGREWEKNKHIICWAPWLSYLQNWTWSESS
jgi:hypothetical protein